MKYRPLFAVLFYLLGLFEKSSCFIDSMDPTRLHHIFGTRSRDKIPDFWLDSPDRSISGRGFFYDVTLEGSRERFWLESKEDILANDFHVVTREADNSSLSLASPHSNCLYQGHSVSHNGSVIALTGCSQDMHGMVITANGEYYLIQPQARDSTQHIIHKRAARQREEQHTCLFDPKSDPYPEDLAHHVRKRRSGLLERDRREYRAVPVMKSDELTIELAVFADDAMWRHFVHMYPQTAEAELHKFILAAVNNIDILYTQRTIQPRIKIRVVRYEVIKSPPSTLSSSSHSSGDVDRLLDSFCDYQHEINPTRDDDPRHWDHALLFSGYDLYRDGLYTVAGYAPVKGMCSGRRSCTINEGVDFGSVFVVTHEMGHSLGMYHDGDNDCDLRCCIMSPSVGTGKTHWSRCSVNEMNAFIGHLGSEFRPPNCLRDSPIEEEDMVFKDQDNPGQIFTLSEQCEIFHGECWDHELKDGQALEDVCSMVWCGNGEGVIRTAHPALEGSYCGQGKQCRSGWCVPSSRALYPTHGGWSSWNDHPGAACGGRCGHCLIQGQIRVRRSTRQCNRPSPNNGGATCPGDGARGIRCSQQTCSGVSVTSFATSKCSEIRDDKSTPNPHLTGEGLQFEQAPCKIWCMMTLSNNIRTISNFPDGTPCGGGRYCIKGECRPLLCSGTTIAAYSSDCVSDEKWTNQTPSPRPQQPWPPKANPYKEDTKKFPAYWNEWSGWSEWSQCISYSCESRGVRVRTRRCLAGNCIGDTRERSACSAICTGWLSTAAPPTAQQITLSRTAPREWSRQAIQSEPVPSPDWSNWSGCSVSCGRGKRIRRKKNCQHHCTEVSVCDMSACPSASVSTWSEWGEWSDCSRTCDTGLQVRRRICRGESACQGAESQAKRCREKSCASASNGWTAWSVWSSCSTSCGSGSRTRSRRCYLPPCQGDVSERVVCYNEACPSWRQPRDTADQSIRMKDTGEKREEEEEVVYQSSGSTGGAAHRMHPRSRTSTTRL